MRGTGSTPDLAIFSDTRPVDLCFLRPPQSGRHRFSVPPPPSPTPFLPFATLVSRGTVPASRAPSLLTDVRPVDDDAVDADDIECLRIVAGRDGPGVDVHAGVVDSVDELVDTELPVGV
jgi:hypothetical protein